ncbi:acetyltransferase [Rhodococcus sp. Leaf278]|nr:acetyltransferase [Rhodococcus sp. Leaf278]
MRWPSTVRATLFAVSAHPLDDPVRNSLDGPLSRFAVRRGRIVRADPEVSPFLAHPDVLDQQDWDDIEALFGLRTVVGLDGPERALPEGWSRVEAFGLVQLIGTHLETRPFSEAVELTAADVPEMLDLVRRTEPGPFLARTIELGTYLGVRRDGALIAMAGERMHPPGWTEISAVCTDPAFRGHGLATDLVRAVGHGIRARGEEPFLHASAANVRAIDLYLAIGFELRRTSQLTLVRTPERAPDA